MTCGPASFGAACRTPVTTAIGFFPYFHSRNWTTLGDMRNALQIAQTRFVDSGNILPQYGLALLQLRVNEGPLHGLYSLRQTHWVAVCGEYFYDVNWSGWLPVPIWRELVLTRLRFGEKPVRRWEVRNGIEILDEHLIAAALGDWRTAASQRLSAVCQTDALVLNCRA